MFTKELPEQNTLHIVPCNKIHTFNMRYSIDILYLDVNSIMVAIDEVMKPSKIGKHVKKAKLVEEIPSGKIKNKR